MVSTYKDIITIIPAPDIRDGYVEVNTFIREDDSLHTRVVAKDMVDFHEPVDTLALLQTTGVCETHHASVCKDFHDYFTKEED